MTIALLGYGRFGKALAGLLQQAGHGLRVFDPHAEVPVEIAARSASAAVDAAPWVILAMPVAHLPAALEGIRPLLGPGHTVLDVGSVKLHPCATMDEVLGTEIPHAGTHPLFGPLSLARGDRPLRVVICAAAAHPEAARRTGDLFRSLGCEVFERDPASHDRAMAQTHALAFFVAKGLVAMHADDDMVLAPPSSQGMQHMVDAVRGDAGHLFATIQRENPFAADARAELLDALQQIHRQLQSEADDAALAVPGRGA